MIFVTHKNIFLGIILAVFLISGGIIFKFGLPLGIDFTGGALTEVSYSQLPDKLKVEELLAGKDLGMYSLRQSSSEEGREGYVLRTRDLNETERIDVEDTLLSAGQDSKLERFASVGPVIGQELKDKAAWAIGAVVIVIMLYVAYAFRGIGKLGNNNVRSWMYGAITIIALAHDVLVPTAAFSLLGYFMGAEADVLFVMALLAVLGYSVNDTIVMFDRVRENLEQNQEKAKQLLATHGKKGKEEAEAIENEPFDITVGRSIQEALLRFFNISLTTMLTLGALYWLGGDITKNFALILLVGVAAGAYSSIILANPLLVYISERLPEPKPKPERVKPPMPGMPV